MKASTLHITNGDSTTNYLKKLRFSGEFITWREMLCEGKTTTDVGSESFWKNRFDFGARQQLARAGQAFVWYFGCRHKRPRNPHGATHRV